MQTIVNNLYPDVKKIFHNLDFFISGEILFKKFLKKYLVREKQFPV